MSENPLDLQAPGGYTSIISHLVAQLTMTKYVIVQKVKPLSVDNLDARIVNHANTIGLLLKHMIALEKRTQTIVFLNRDLNELEKTTWNEAFSPNLSLSITKANSIEFYLNLWEDVRNFTLEHLKAVDDAWLYKRPHGYLAGLGNNYYCIFHFMEDQISHYGQIKSMIKYL